MMMAQEPNYVGRPSSSGTNESDLDADDIAGFSELGNEPKASGQWVDGRWIADDGESDHHAEDGA
jgi:hypothetical protein